MSKRKDISPITSPDFKQKEKVQRSDSSMMDIDNAHPVITEADNSGQSNPQSNSSSETVIEPMQKGRTTYAESVHSYAGSWDKGTTNMINVEITGLNGQAFKGTFNRSDGFELFEKALKLELDKLWGLSIWYQGTPRVRYKLKESIHLESTFPRDDFMYERAKDNLTDFINGRILGYRKPQELIPNETQFNPIGNTVRVNLYGCSYNFKREQVEEWIQHFGDQISAQEEIMDKDRPSFGTGDISVRVKLRKHIPQFLPMFGKRIRVAYRGMTSLCTNCFEPGHVRFKCTSERVSFVQYVKVFKRESTIPEHCFGNWARILENMERFGQRDRQSDRNRASKETPMKSIEEEQSQRDDNGQLEENTTN